MALAHAVASMVKLTDGRILAISGGDPDETSAVTEIYTESAPPAWQSYAVLPSARENHTATLLKDGRVAFIGGSADMGISQDDGMIKQRILGPTANLQKPASTTQRPFYKMETS